MHIPTRAAVQLLLQVDIIIYNIPMFKDILYVMEHNFIAMDDTMDAAQWFWWILNGRGT